MSSGRELTLTVDNAGLTGNGTPTIGPGGTWADKADLSYRLIAWDGPGETNPDKAGGGGGIVVQWEGKSINANDKIVGLADIPSDAFDHIAFYYQEAASWNGDNVATKCTVQILGIDEDTIQFTVLDDDDTATITFGDTPDSLVVNPIVDIQPVNRENSGVGADGESFAQSHANDQLLEAITYVFSRYNSFSAADYKKLLKWQKDSVHLKIEESLTGTNVFLSKIFGRPLDNNYLLSKFKTRGPEFFISFLVDGETEVA